MVEWTYDRDSFLAGLSVGRTLWKPHKLMPEVFIFTISNEGYSPENFDFNISYLELDGRIYWGDGTYSDFDSSGHGYGYTPTHQYPYEWGVIYTYRVTIVGSLYQIRFHPTTFTGRPKYLISVNTPLPSTVKTAAFMFFQCYHLRVIPSNLFAFSKDIKDFSYCFYYSALEEIPDGLFDSCESAKDVSWCFAMTGTSYGIKYIPEGLFRNCPELEDVSRCFMNYCGEEVPKYLFAGCSKIKNAASCFSGLYSKYIAADIFSDSPLIEDFTQTFGWGGNIVSPLPEFWITHPGAVGTDCYKYCFQASNYNSVPESWGGPTQ